MANKALFLDRDGTINIEKNYLFRIEDFVFREGIFELARDYFGKGYLIFVVTNQSGIARGYYSEDEFCRLTEWMLEKFREQGIEIKKVYYCPHHPDINGACACRKPEPGMILNAIEDFELDPEVCVLVGDHERDIEAGRRAGIKNLYKVSETGRIKIENVALYKS